MLFRKSIHLAAMLAAVALTTAAAHASSFEIVSEKSRVRFEAGHHDYAKPVKGRFHQLSGKIEYDVTSPGYTSMQVIIDPSSVDTDNQYRDSHLRSSFFEVEQFPEIRFQLTQARLA
ncbi:MAG: polyisoprenoid-binding protein YceI, partial [Myxococcota bacterium]